MCSNTTQLKISHNATIVKRRLESSVTIFDPGKQCISRFNELNFLVKEIKSVQHNL